MQINITGHHVEVTEPLKNYVEKKMDKIRKHFDHITNVHVILSIDKQYLQKAEACLNVRGNHKEVFAKSESKDMYAAIDTLMDKLDRQVLKHKEQQSTHH